MTALLDPKRLKWRELATQNIEIPTPWDKAAFDKHAREYQKRREKLRADKRPEQEMESLFAELARMGEEFLRRGKAQRTSRGLRRRDVSIRGLLPTRTELHYVYAQPGVLCGLPGCD